MIDYVRGAPPSSLEDDSRAVEEIHHGLNGDSQNGYIVNGQNGHGLNGHSLNGHSQNGGNRNGHVRVSVVMPTLNEERNLPYVIPRLPDDIHELVLVDGRSTDQTVECARSLFDRLRVVHQVGKGKGSALKQGMDAAEGDIIVTIDADGSTDPAEIPRFVEALCNGADYAKGSRFLEGGGSEDITRLRGLGNWAL